MSSAEKSLTVNPTLMFRDPETNQPLFRPMTDEEMVMMQTASDGGPKARDLVATLLGRLETNKVVLEKANAAAGARATEIQKTWCG